MTSPATAGPAGAAACTQNLSLDDSINARLRESMGWDLEKTVIRIITVKGAVMTVTERQQAAGSQPQRGINHLLDGDTFLSNSTH
jgi:hypothetical protein